LLPLQVSRSGTCHTIAIADREKQKARYLKIPSLLINGNDEFIDVSDQLVAFCLPKSICTLLKQLHQHILIKEKGHSQRRAS
jgi:hypothetical protein